MRPILQIMAALVLLGPAGVLACSFAPGYERFNASEVSGTEPVEPPEIEFKRIKRGFNDGSHGSCSDAGILEFSVPPDRNIGYDFNVVAGGFPDQVFPDYRVKPVSETPGVLRFVWLDYQGGPVERIQATLEIRAVSQSGISSEPVVIPISDSGTASSNWAVGGMFGVVMGLALLSAAAYGLVRYVG